MTMCATLPLPGFELTASNPSTRSVEASPVRTSRSPARVTGWMVSDPVCGDPACAWLATFDRDACSWRMSGLYEGEDSWQFSETLPRSVMTRMGMLFQLPPLVQITSVIASGSPPGASTCSPASSAATSSTTTVWDAIGARTVKVRPLLPTLQAQDFRNASDYSDRSRGHSPQLRHLGQGRLDPSFCETFMGFPTGWTDVE